MQVNFKSVQNFFEVAQGFRKYNDEMGNRWYIIEVVLNSPGKDYSEGKKHEVILKDMDTKMKWYGELEKDGVVQIKGRWYK